MRRHGLVAGLVIVLVAPGCLGNTYSIPKRDLAELTRVEPERRGDRVRVIQQFATADQPPEATSVHVHTAVVIDPGPRRRRTRVRPDGSGGFTKAAAGGAAEAAKEDSKYWIVIAALAAVGLAATEGARFDGWTRLHPMHPVHLFGPFGQHDVVALAQLQPEDAAWAQKAVIVEDEGPWQPLERAPLNRAGFSYSVLMGAAELPSIDGNRLGFMSHIQFGFFPAHELGLQFDIGLGFRDNELGDTIFDGRYAFEVDYLPLTAGILSGGVFGQVGLGTRLEDGAGGGDRQGVLLGGGALAQLEITTRLALTARAQATRFYETTVSDVSLGLSIY